MFLDTHAHLLSILDQGVMTRSELEQLLARGFGPIIDIGTRSQDALERWQVLKDLPNVYFSLGIWPDRQAIAEFDTEMQQLRQQLEVIPANRLVAIGEAGIDRSHNKIEVGTDIAGEYELFRSQASLAQELDLPLIVHSRDSALETYNILKDFSHIDLILHCFSYNREEARNFLDLGAYISFAGTLTYKNAENIREAARYVPLDRILLETDAPYLAPVPHRGKKNRPDYIGATFEKLAELRQLSTQEIHSQIRKNVQDCFGI